MIIAIISMQRLLSVHVEFFELISSHFSIGMNNILLVIGMK